MRDTRATRIPLLYTAFVAACGLVGIVSGSYPIALLVLPALVLAWRAPSALACVAILLGLTDLPILVQVGSLSAITAVQTGLVALAGLGAWFRVGLALRQIWPFLTAALVGVIAGWGTLPAAQLLVGLRIFLLPIAAFVAGRTLSRRGFRQFAFVTLAVLLLNLLVATYEQIVGIPALVGMGLNYGTQVRQIGQVLRAPGLTPTNFDLGLTAAVFGAILIWAVTERQVEFRRWMAWLGFLVPVGCIALSGVRTGLIVLFGSVAPLVLRLGQRRLGARVAAILLASAAFVGVAWFSSLDAASWGQRLVLWRGLFDAGVPWFGHGLGSAGAATSSHYVTSQAVVVDNYYLSVVLQAGVVGVVLFVFGLFVLSRPSRLHGEWPVPRSNLALVLGIGSGMVLLEIWEYATAMILVMLTLGFSNSAHVFSRKEDGLNEGNDRSKPPVLVTRKPV